MATDFHKILKQNWGYDSFRPKQLEIIQSVATGNDTLALLPTGGGKSITYQVPALSKEGICLVITPLIALMKDQVENLKKRKIKALAIFSGMTHHEIGIALDNCRYGNYKFLYLSPERLGTELFLARIKDLNINLIAVDEAHCISQWGYDFRPSYLKIAAIRAFSPNVPVLAVTATATSEVVDDIQEKLQFKAKKIIRKSFARDNLLYIVRKVEDKYNYLLRIITKTPGTGIIYVRNRKKTREISDFLQQNNISTDYYHAGLSHEWRNYKQAQWKNGGCRIMVCTNAFGMGIDKPDVRFVVHMDLPDSLEAYYQEAGRGGRDGKPAYAVVLYDGTDVANLKRKISAQFPPVETIKKVYQAIGNYYQIPVGGGKNQTLLFKLADCAKRYELNHLTVYNSLKILEYNEYLELTEQCFIQSKILFTVARDDLYRFQVENIKFDAFIKIIMRSYTGLFTDYTAIDENELAKRAGTTREVVYQYLKKLQQNKIINYIPQRKTPYIVFAHERVEQKALNISKESYDLRKQRADKKADAVLNYIENTDTCRSRILLEYFGETDINNCNQCDICKKTYKTSVSSEAFRSIAQIIKQNTFKQGVSVEYLCNSVCTQMNFNDDKKILKVIRQLCDDGQLFYSKKDKKLHWRQKKEKKKNSSQK